VPKNVSQDNEDHIRKRKPQSDSFQKAKILESLVSYTNSLVKIIEHNFTGRTILLRAITGAAATEIGSRTSALVSKYMRKMDHKTHDDIEFFQDTRLSVIDEIQFAPTISFWKKKQQSGRTSGMPEIHVRQTC
jgi:ABC-type transport system involved in cytochrome c biogenesis ATPase subunit